MIYITGNVEIFSEMISQSNIDKGIYSSSFNNNFTDYIVFTKDLTEQSLYYGDKVKITITDIGCSSIDIDKNIYNCMVLQSNKIIFIGLDDPTEQIMIAEPIDFILDKITISNFYRITIEKTDEDTSECFTCYRFGEY